MIPHTPNMIYYNMEEENKRNSTFSFYYFTIDKYYTDYDRSRTVLMDHSLTNKLFFFSSEMSLFLKQSYCSFGSLALSALTECR